MTTHCHSLPHTTTNHYHSLPHTTTTHGHSSRVAGYLQYAVPLLSNASYLFAPLVGWLIDRTGFTWVATVLVVVMQTTAASLWLGSAYAGAQVWAQWLSSELPPAYNRHPTSYILGLTSYIRHPTSYILHPTSYIRHPTS